MSSKNSSVEKLRELLKNPPKVNSKEISPYLDAKTEGDPQLGKQIKAGCLVVAGGQGTRLGFKGPKGLFPITAIKHKTLFQYLLEKVKCTGQKLAIMTSPLNDKETRAFFANEDVSFFTQKMLPMLNDEGEAIQEGPDGNGNALKYFVESGIWEKWKSQGVECISYILVDNPLADPFDAEMIGLHIKEKADVTIKCIKRVNAQEKVGVLAKRQGKIAVVEYSELPQTEEEFPLANISHFCFSMEFVKKCANIELPLHLTHKKNLWKFETFIFDVLPFAEKVEVLLSPREECFAPLKDDPEPVREALQKADRKQFEKVAGVAPPDVPFELDPAFYYPTKELLKKWKGRPLPSEGYISADR